MGRDLKLVQKVSNFSTTVALQTRRKTSLAPVSCSYHETTNLRKNNFALEIRVRHPQARHAALRWGVGVSKRVLDKQKERKCVNARNAIHSDRSKEMRILTAFPPSQSIAWLLLWSVGIKVPVMTSGFSAERAWMRNPLNLLLDPLLCFNSTASRITHEVLPSTKDTHENKKDTLDGGRSTEGSTWRTLDSSGIHPQAVRRRTALLLVRFVLGDKRFAHSSVGGSRREGFRTEESEAGNNENVAEHHLCHLLLLWPTIPAEWKSVSPFIPL